jgi:hypothetical protein
MYMTYLPYFRFGRRRPLLLYFIVGSISSIISGAIPIIGAG